MTQVSPKPPADGWLDAVRHWLAPDKIVDCSGEVGAARNEPAPHTHVLVPARLRSAGLDDTYESVAEPELVAALKAICSTCAHTCACTRDFAAENANERVSEYCPNTPAIDELIVERAIGRTI